MNPPGLRAALFSARGTDRLLVLLQASCLSLGVQKVFSQLAVNQSLQSPLHMQIHSDYSILNGIKSRCALLELLALPAQM